jgi:hypothetical protein
MRNDGMSDMLLLAVLLLAAGALVLRAVRPKSATGTFRRWLPIAAFICGPLWAIGYSLADAFWICPENYVLPGDYVVTFVHLIAIGLFGGTVGAIVLGLADRP